MLNVFRLWYTRIFIDNYPPTLFYHKNDNVWLYEYIVEGLACGFNRKRGLAETDSYFIKVWHVWIEPKVYTTTCRSFFIFALVWREKLTKTEYYICHKMSCIIHHTLVRWCTNAALERPKCRDWCAVQDVSIIL